MITYKKRRRYKYVLVEDYRHQTGLRPGAPVDIAPVLHLAADGLLTIQKGYAWDGPSGPTWDTRNFMRASLVHDALYQLMREERLPRMYRDTADQLLRQICLEDGMCSICAWWVYHAVRLFGASSAAAALHSAP
jgi:hypothetical protein